MKDLFSQSNGCTPGEMDIRSADGIHSRSMAYRAEFQSDSAQPGMEDGRLTLGKVTDVLRSPASPVNEGWLRTMALVQCRSNNMSLTIKKTESAHLMIDQGDAPPLPLSPMLLCGYSVETSWRDLEFTTLYDGCHIRQEDGRNVLSLIWRGTPVKMSCPVRPRLAPLSLCCDPFGMTITVAGSRSAAEIGVDVGYGWRSLASVAEQCRYIIDAHPEKLVVSVPFSTCGVTFKDQKYTLSLQSEEGESVFTCPAPPSAPVSAPKPPSSHTHHPQPSPAPQTGPRSLHSGRDTANPPAAPEERTPKPPMFSWHPPHRPETATRDNSPDTRPAESPYLHPGVPILYPEPPPNLTTNPRDPPLPNLLMYPPNPHPPPGPRRALGNARIRLQSRPRTSPQIHIRVPELEPWSPMTV
ncbi:hypothetical protein GJAV_G00226110 [Gymnothorax javanicus]|nr:hypothetical protein GJAV_G00226110 [Gymnothorax javanicus]